MAKHCYSPAAERSWGWAVQLYALRSEASWGIGDLADLRMIAEDAARAGGCVLVNPLHAPPPDLPRETSPYYAGSRCFLDPLYLRIEDIPGARDSDGFAELAAAGRSLNERRMIDRDAVWDLKMRALEAAWADFDGDAGFDRFRAEGGDALEGYATFTALSEVQRGDRRSWPPEIGRPAGHGIDAFKREHARRIRFHAWVQWLLDVQARAASASGNLIYDLAVGVAPTGADAWFWQDAFLQGATVGAPPDDYNREGQDWAVLGFDPRTLEGAGYEPLIATLRAGMRNGVGLRIDHVMGLFRLFMIPDGASARDGAYVRFPAERMLDVVALESQRTRCYVIGEDLGTVEPVVRATMRDRSMLSYKLMWFEDRAPRDFPAEAMAAINTHDLPTIAGLWSGADAAAEEAAGLDTNEPFKRAIVSRIVEQLGVDPDATVTEVIDRSYEALATAPCRLVMGALEDVLEVTERHNHPGTVGPWNWSTALPGTLERILTHPRKAVLQDMLADRMVR